MFKKIKHSNGLREVYFGKIRLLKYTNKRASLDYKFSLLNGQILATLRGWINYFKSLLALACISKKYHHIFYDFYLRTQNDEKLVFVDGGAHAGVFSDVALACGGLCYAFEPNIYLATFLKNRYKDEPKFVLFQQALSNKNEKSIFYNIDTDLINEGNSIISIHKGIQERAYDVQCIDFCEFARKLLEKHGKINFLKLDIEGAEFELLDSLIEQKLYENIEFIMVETHERFFENPKEKINKLKEKIEKYEIKNIYLDWV